MLSSSFILLILMRKHQTRITCECQTGTVGTLLWMWLEMKSGTHLGFLKSAGKAQRTESHSCSVCRSPAAKQEVSTSQFSTREETRWTSWLCIPVGVGQRQLKSGALEIQLLRQKGCFFFSINHQLHLRLKDFRCCLILVNWYNFPRIRKKSEYAQMCCRMRHILMAFAIRHA